ncbi:mitotic spindle assembly checkpoint protein MAD2B isoform X1 [Daktulosphaira vitifoliae]|uniref:mitotic spindle assembly checkpoint protein MAD2B isoform X1 n=1 Tax=Daktulosphaira vitifoliae TaxID=58002 RepID=UPI0021AA0892|nr:mitotic spindle assembly checkpoint protein MAD2B isoform X1 [Daktulosphaira vitifoliae]
MSKEKFSDSVSVFIELLEVSIHCILYARKIYPEGIFELKKKYNVPVHISIYPELNNYINSTLNAVKNLLKVKKLRQVDICFYNRFGKAIERFVINIHKIELELDFSDIQNLRDPYLVKLEQMLRALCLKLTVCDSMLNPLPSECTFLIHVHTTETASIEVQKHTEGFPLIPSEDKLTQLNSPSIIPMRSIECEYLKLEIYVEEGIKDEDPDLFTPSPLL